MNFREVSMNEIDLSTLWYQTNLDIFLNRWFSNYEDARRAREAGAAFYYLINITSSCAKGK